MKTSISFKQPSPLSRRQWIRTGLTTCGGLLAAGRLALAQSGDTLLPVGYTRPGPITDLGRAPGMQTRLVAETANGEMTYAVILAKGDEILSGVTAFAIRENFTSGSFTGIGALQRATFGWFDEARRAFREIPIDEQVELVSLIGDVGLVDGRPAIHAHGAVALPDGRVHGGHLLEAVVSPTLELFFTGYSTPLTKTRDEETGLFLFDLTA
jgi:predicted DNA-binding protein with PD1-like motif